MPGQRSKDQKLIPVPMSEDFIREINAAVKKAGYPTRAQFMRDAILEKIQSLGIKLPSDIAVPPPAFSREKPRRLSDSPPLYRGRPSSSAAPADLALVDAAEDVADKTAPGLSRLNEADAPSARKRPPSAASYGASKARRATAKRVPK